MAGKCKTGQVWDQKLEKCKPAPNRQKRARLKAETKQKNRKVLQKIKKVGPSVGDDTVRFDNFQEENTVLNQRGNYAG